MKRIACWVSLLLSCLLLCAACQPTPERAPVINKGDGKFEQELKEAQESEKNSSDTQATETLEPYVHPTNWTEVLDLPNFTVTINADVKVPEKSIFPVFRVQNISFSTHSEALQSILNALIPDADGVRSGGMTREKCEERIIYLQWGRYDDELRKYVPYTPQEQEQVDAEIQTLTDQMKTAPSKDDFAPKTGGFQVDVPSNYVYRTKGSKQWEVNIEESALTVSQPGARSYPESMFINDKSSPGRPAPTPYQEVSISEEDARTIVSDFFSAINNDTWVITNIERSGMLKEYYNVLTDDKTETEGWQVDCMRGGENSILFDILLINILF